MAHEECKSYAPTMFAQHTELFPEDRRQSILDGVVLVGMTPFEARLRGGGLLHTRLSRIKQSGPRMLNLSK
ncbi:hypothetical protein GCM10010946_20510 [Undibacterium squillarum]|uniref:Uncharacterized protein n=1 Tax=Undibacterium squillarum TaxID=1131567 RepID=A0ABQ2XYM7_9BURK|nr:hypothetical protein GCM10010946_20510 [Undibacterium squillarum]